MKKPATRQENYKWSELNPNLEEEESMAAAGALVYFGRSCCAIKAGRYKVFVKVWDGGDGCVSEARDKDVFVLVLSDG